MRIPSKLFLSSLVAATFMAAGNDLLDRIRIRFTPEFLTTYLPDLNVSDINTLLYVMEFTRHTDHSPPIPVDFWNIIPIEFARKDVLKAMSTFIEDPRYVQILQHNHDISDDIINDYIEFFGIDPKLYTHVYCGLVMLDRLHLPKNASLIELQRKIGFIK